jgi:hypothetical protein
MNDLIVVESVGEWDRLKALVLDCVSSPITRRVYNMALDEFIAWFKEAPRPGFSKATVSAWRVSLEARGLGSSSIIIRMSAIRKLIAGGEAQSACVSDGFALKRSSYSPSLPLPTASWRPQQCAPAPLRSSFASCQQALARYRADRRPPAATLRTLSSELQPFGPVLRH